MCAYSLGKTTRYRNARESLATPQPLMRRSNIFTMPVHEAPLILRQILQYCISSHQQTGKTFPYPVFTYIELHGICNSWGGSQRHLGTCLGAVYTCTCRKQPGGQTIQRTACRVAPLLGPNVEGSSEHKIVIALYQCLTADLAETCPRQRPRHEAQTRFAQPRCNSLRAQ